MAKPRKFSAEFKAKVALAALRGDRTRAGLCRQHRLAGWFGSFDRYAGKGKAGADSANWLSMFNAERIIVDRKTGIPQTIHVPQAAVCVIGGIQPGILQRALGTKHREYGLAARFLLSYPPRMERRWTECDIDPKLKAELAELFERLYDLKPAEDDEGKPRPVLVRLDRQARLDWIDDYNSHATEKAT